MFFLVAVIVVVGGMFLLRKVYYSYEDSYWQREAARKKTTATTDFKWAYTLACNEDVEKEARADATSEKGAEMREEIGKVIGSTPTTQMVFLGLMAEKGKIPLDVMKYGLCYWYPYNWDDDTRKFNLTRLRKFVIWYDKKLRENEGFDADLRLISNELMKRGGDERWLISVPVADIEKHEPIGGVCCWSFNVYTIDEHQAFKVL